MRLLTLDLSSHVGWTSGPMQGPFDSGTYDIKSKDLGGFFLDFERWLAPMLKGIDICAYESPIMPRITQLVIVQKLSGLAGFVECACKKLRIDVHSVNNMQLKKFMGDGWMSKDRMFQTVKMFGHDPQTYDEADAIAIRLYMISKLAPKTAARMKLDLGLLGALV